MDKAKAIEHTLACRSSVDDIIKFVASAHSTKECPSTDSLRRLEEKNADVKKRLERAETSNLVLKKMFRDAFGVAINYATLLKSLAERLMPGTSATKAPLTATKESVNKFLTEEARLFQDDALLSGFYEAFNGRLLHRHLLHRRRRRRRRN